LGVGWSSESSARLEAASALLGLVVVLVVGGAAVWTLGDRGGGVFSESASVAVSGGITGGDAMRVRGLASTRRHWTAL